MSITPILVLLPSLTKKREDIRVSQRYGGGPPLPSVRYPSFGGLFLLIPILPKMLSTNTLNYIPSPIIIFINYTNQYYTYQIFTRPPPFVCYLSEANMIVVIPYVSMIQTISDLLIRVWSSRHKIPSIVFVGIHLPQHIMSQVYTLVTRVPMCITDFWNSMYGAPKWGPIP